MRKVAEQIYGEKVFSGEDHMQSANLYLVAAQPRSLLVDTGYSYAESQAAVLEMLDTLGVSPDALDVFITHNHPDHAGLARLLSQRGARIYMKREEQESYAMICGYYVKGREESLQKLAQYGFSSHQAEIIMEHTFVPGYAYHDYVWEGLPIHDLSEGQQFQYGPYTFETVALPGHTEHQMGLAEHQHKWLFVGDTLSRNEVLILSAIHPGENLLSLQRETFDRLHRDFSDYWMVPGHANPFHGPDKAIEKTLRYFSHISKRVCNAFDSVEEPLTLAQVVEKIFRYKPEQIQDENSMKLHFRLANTLACLNDLTQKEILCHTENQRGWQWVWNKK